MDQKDRNEFLNAGKRQGEAPEQNAAQSASPDAEDKDLVWEEVRTEHIVQDAWIDFRRSSFRFPDGNVFEPYYTYSRRDYVVIVARDTQGKYLCVRQFRQGIRKVTTEFPAGGIERGENEDALKAAKRELLEETGYVSDEWQSLLTIPSNATIADNTAYLFFANNCRKESGQSLDAMEFLNVHLLDADEIGQRIAEGRFEQAMHILAWLLAGNASRK